MDGVLLDWVGLGVSSMVFPLLSPGQAQVNVDGGGDGGREVKSKSPAYKIVEFHTLILLQFNN